MESTPIYQPSFEELNPVNRLHPILVSLQRYWPCALMGIFMVALGLDMVFLLNPAHNVGSAFFRLSLYDLHFQQWGWSIAICGFVQTIAAGSRKSASVRFWIAAPGNMLLCILTGMYWHGCATYPHMWHSFDLVPVSFIGICSCSLMLKLLWNMVHD